MVMVSNQSTMDFGYMAGRWPGRIGHLYAPGGIRSPRHWMPYALDNGAWPAFINKIPWSEGRWRALMRWSVLQGQRPLWAVVPDVVQDAAGTIDNWARYEAEVRAYGYRPAFALQNGMTFGDIPDSECMLFLGGSDEWKDAAIGPWCERFPGRVHVGRVNKPLRLIRAWHAGAVSVDGTGWYHRKTGQLAELYKFLKETGDDERQDRETVHVRRSALAPEGS